MLERLRKVNRTLLELMLGILFLGLIMQMVGMFAAEEILKFTAGMWLGVIAAMASALHIYVTLDKALELEAMAVYRKTVSSAMLRYFCWAMLLGIVMLTKVLNPIHTFFGLLTLKVAAYLQPFTHKFCNFIFQETDPIPEAIPWEDEN